MISSFVNLICLIIQSGRNAPPEPRLSSQAGDPEGPHLPIDGELWVLLILGIILGIYLIHKRQQIKNKVSTGL